MKWFKHDSDSSTDAKLQKVQLKYGMEGYGLYFYCLELIARNVEKHNLTFELEHDAELIANATKINQELVQEMMTFMINLDLFEVNSGVISCMKMATRTDEYTQKLIRSQGNVPTLSRQTPDSVPIKSLLREEKRREEKRVDGTKKRSVFKKPSIQEIKQYISDNNYSVDGGNFFDFYESKGWMVGKSPMKKWESALSQWNRRNKKDVKPDMRDDHAI